MYQPPPGPPGHPPPGYAQPGYAPAYGQPPQYAPMGYPPPGYAPIGPPQSFRVGALIVAQDGAALPPLCVKCGALMDGAHLHRTFFWHPQWIYFFFLMGAVPYIVFAAIFRKQASVYAGLCAAHRAARTRAMIAWPIVLVLGLVSTFAGAGNDLPALILLGLAGIIGSIVWAAIALRVLRPQKIDQGWMWLSGASPELLKWLPPMPGPGPFG